MPLTRLERRALIIGAGATLISVPLGGLALAEAPLIVTPGQTEGPFYPVKLPPTWMPTWCG